MVNFLSRVIIMSTPLLLGSIAEVYAERTGMMICAIEGIFLIGAWGGFVGTYLSGSQALGLLMAMGCGLMMAALYGLITVYMKQQQVVTGTALQILSAGFCSFFHRVIFGVPITPLQIKTLPKLAIPLLSRIPFIGPIYSPSQGLFPKYTSGIYEEGGTKMYVSRGIGNGIAPLRFNDGPELAVIVLTKER